MVKVNIGCGKSNFGTDWIHIDGKSYEHTDNSDIHLLSFAENTIDIIYASHFIAYFDREEAVTLLKTWHKKLKLGGELIISTPDWDALREIPQPLIGPLYGKMNEPPIYHKTVYNYHDLYTVLRKAGFINIDRYGPIYEDQSKATYAGKYISLNIHCNA